MNEKEMVFIDPPTADAIPFTTSEVIAECTGVQHHTVTRLLRDNKADFEEFGVYGFQIHKPPLGSAGGRPEKVYCLNEEQATLLITYLKNTPQVRKFKKELVRQFYAMREELTRRRIQQVSLKPVRRTMTDAIRDFVPDSPHKNMQYRNYTNLAYMTAMGMTAKAIRRARGASRNANAVEFLTAEELQAVERASRHISVLLENGLDYGQVKEVLAQTSRLLMKKTP